MHTHRSWDRLTRETNAEIDFHHELGCDFSAIGGMPDIFWKKGAPGFSQFTKSVKPLIRKLKAAGIRFGYHNHMQEFSRISPQKTLYDILIEKGARDLFLEVDVYWAFRAGINPVKIFERCAGRVPVIHVKDGGVIRKDIIWDMEGFVQLPVGEGNLDWDTYLGAFKKAKVEWYTAEQDECIGNAFDCLKSSYDYLRSKGV
jgi:sugar phosphate isomerase/epimerase